MSRTKNPVLSEKHLKALSLIERGEFSLDSVAKQVGWKPDHLYKLYGGDVSSCGSVASLFEAEVLKIDKVKTQKVNELMKTSKTLAMEQIVRILDDYKHKQRLSEDDKRIIANLTNAIAKATPSVKINSLSYSYTTGYTPEQLIYEFKRLQTLAGSSSNRGAVSGTSEGGTGEISPSSRIGSENEEEQ